MFTEDDLLPISGLQHFIFCERQCALIHLEQIWQENRFTAEGRVQHERVHEAATESRGKIRIVRGLRLRSLALGLIGVADVVEFHRGKEVGAEEVPFPVEYKRGKPKADCCDEVQLCAQALCLEEMLDTFVPSGALFYGKTRRRKDVVIDDGLRALTKETAAQFHRLMKSGIVPAAVYGKKCETCSLKDACMPQVNRSAEKYVRSVIQSAFSGGEAT